MAKNSITDYSKTASLNTDIQSVDIDEGCLPSGINNAIRELMADLAAVNDGTVALTSPAFTSVDINSGTIDGVTIGGASAAAGTFTTFTSTGIDDNASSTAVTINSSNNVGIGTAGRSASGYTILGVDNATNGGVIEVLQNGTIKGQLFYDGTQTRLRSNLSTDLVLDTNDTERMRIDSSGRVGIGENSPSNPLEVVGNVRIKSAAGDTQGLNISSDGNGDAFIDAGYSVSDLKFGINGTERMRIDSIGRVGIGTSSPAADLDVNGEIIAMSGSGVADRHIEIGVGRTGNGNSYVDLIGDTTYTDYGARLIRYNTGANATTRLDHRGTGNLSLWATDAGALQFGTSNTERMRIDSSGNVGIGGTTTTGWANKQVVLDAGSDTSAAFVMVNNTTGRTATDGALMTLSGSDFYLINRESANMIFRTANTERMRIDSSGRLLVNGTSSLYGQSIMQVTSGSNTWTTMRNTDTGSAQQYTMVFARSSSNVGAISTTNTSTIFTTSSDYRLKENVTGITDGIERVKQLAPSRFNFIANADTTVDGFLAHEAQTVVPEAVTGEKDAMRDEEYEVTPAVYEDVVIPAVLDDDGNEIEAERTEQQLVTEAVMGTRSVPDYQGIDQSKLVPLLTAALQEAIAKIENLEARLATLEAN